MEVSINNVSKIQKNRFYVAKSKRIRYNTIPNGYRTTLVEQAANNKVSRNIFSNNVGRNHRRKVSLPRVKVEEAFAETGRLDNEGCLTLFLEEAVKSVRADNAGDTI